MNNQTPVAGVRRSGISNEAGGPPKGKENSNKQKQTKGIPKMKKPMKSGFTLIELLVVVAIIAVIGAGVAVTYNRLDQRAKTAMEINDIGELTQTIKN